MRRSLKISLFGIVLVALLALGGTFLADNSPQLGLDLQGGASVTLEPENEVPSDTLNQAIEIIRNRVDALGVAEPDITRQGSAVVVQLPGVKDQRRALQIVGQTAQLRFRPVLEELPPGGVLPTTTTTAAEGKDKGKAKATTTTTAPDMALTPPADDEPDKIVVLAELEDGKETHRYRLGPASFTGRAVKTATAEFGQEGWAVAVVLTSKGLTQFNEVAAPCYAGQPTCPTKQLGIALDGVVKSAPVIQTPNFDDNGVQITGNFNEREAKDLALVLRFGALPVQLEPQTVQTVSATLGKDSLRAGVIAGLVGLAMVLFYMVLYYRGLGFVVMLGLGVSGALLWSIISYLGESRGLALTLAGATGIIVSIGVTVDSYVVYFERLKDEIKTGKTLRSSVDRGFTRAYRTIVAADLVSLIGAGLLYWLTVGSVRGFAFFLGLSTLLDMFVAYFFTRPMVVFIGRSRFATPRFLGIIGTRVPSAAAASAPGGGGR